MIQRIQSFYMLLSGIFYLIYWYFGMEWYKNGPGFEILTQDFYYIFGISNLSETTSFFPLLIGLTCLISILLYNNIKIQMKILKITCWSSVYFCIYSLFYFYHSLNNLLEIMPSTIMEILLYAAILNPFICTYLIYLSIKSVNKDQNLLDSLDRIR